MPKEIDIPLEHLTLKAQVWGDGSSSKKIIALHGWLDSSASFEPLAPLIVGADVIAVDLPGHGHSEHKPEGFVHHFVDAVHDILCIADQLGFEKFSLMGHSMGAGISTLVAAAAPERVESLILIDGLGPLSAAPSESIDRLQTHLRQLRRLGQKKFPTYKTIEEAMAARLTAGDLSESACRVLVKRGLKEVEAGFTWRSDARLRIKSAQSFTEEQILVFIKAIQCPTLLLRAQPGFTPNILRIEERKKHLKQVEYHELAGSHHLHMDSPHEVAAIINKFLEKIKTN